MEIILSFRNHLTQSEVRLISYGDVLVVRRYWTDQVSGNTFFQTVGGMMLKGRDGTKALDVFKRTVARAVDDPTEYAP